MRSALAPCLALCLLASCADREAPSGAAPATASSRGPAAPVRRRAALEIRATFTLDVDSDERAATLGRQLAAFAEAHDGWVQSSSLGDGGGAHVVLRVPPDSLGALRATLARAAGAEGFRESTSATDVTDALADLDARLRAARLSETRLLALLEQRTGALADVLAVERSLEEVRTRIEQLEAEQRGAQGRVDRATVEVWLRQDALDVRAPLGRQVTAAARDGVRALRVVAVGSLLLALRAGPLLLALAALGGALWGLARLARRRG